MFGNDRYCLTISHISDISPAMERELEPYIMNEPLSPNQMSDDLYQSRSKLPQSLSMAHVM